MSSPQSPECDHRSTEKGWRDIASAPKDGTRIDIWFRLSADHGARWTGCWWSYERCNWIGGPSSQYEGGWVATHWMLPPAPPVPHPPAHQENSPRPAPEPAPQVREALVAAQVALSDGGVIGPLADDALNKIAVALYALTPVVAREPIGWHLASMNDGLFIINAAPRPSNDDVWPDRPDGPTIVLNVTELPEAKAIKIVGVLNSLTSPPPASAVREALEGIQTIAECALVGPKRNQTGNLESIATMCRRALSALSTKGAANAKP